ncbi:DUF4129 domain-containing protein [Exilibacterium tricleocarpae]|uniref:DUF4129 domain-containing protein n=1 Tax=Exilibacterium tricleocarpae TaxID=2591008 RepID=A0A545T2A5_9GAMM|nr:DUF4129 domain-containing protein [Exilibacterium tricleocarpae]TQV71358.1 DUF4129 domain-containing protein [Exilibacterium tricleocarpae]
MKLSRVAAEIRPRSPWEAVDLGILMARRWWWPLTRAWVLVALPPTLLLHLLPPIYLWWSTLFMWWLKPLWERPLLYILSQALFGHLPGTLETLRACPELMRRHWLAPLTWLRLSPMRSMDLPVSQLEQLSGAERRHRVLVLRREDAAPAGWLTVIGIHLETILAFSAYLLIYFFIPDEFDINYSRLLQQEAFWWLALQNTIYFCAITLVAPFYVACGFALYLNRRIKLEGWDIEIAFRRILQKRTAAKPLQTGAGQGIPQNASPSNEQTTGQSTGQDSKQSNDHSASQGDEQSAGKHPGPHLAIAAALTLSLALALLPPVAQAQPEADGEPVVFDRTTAKQRIGEILAGEDFHRKETVYTPVFGDGTDPQAETGTAPDWARALLSWLANSIETIIWALVVALALLLAYRYRRWLAQLSYRGPAPPVSGAAPDTLFDPAASAANPPADAAAAALSLWQQGRAREAVALLYRTALIQLTARGLAVQDGNTEAECVRQVQAREPAATAAYFAALTQLWQSLAYGHQQPTDQQILRLCEQWRECIPQTPVEARPR